MKSKEIQTLNDVLERGKTRLTKIHEKKQVLEENPMVAEYQKLVEEEHQSYWRLKLLEESLFLGQIRDCEHHMVVYNKEGKAVYHCLECGLNNSGEEVNIAGRSFTLDYSWSMAFPDGNPDIEGAYNSLEEAEENYQPQKVSKTPKIKSLV